MWMHAKVEKNIWKKNHTGFVEMWDNEYNGVSVYCRNKNVKNITITELECVLAICIDEERKLKKKIAQKHT